MRTDINILIDQRLVENLVAPALKGHLTLQEALTRLLSGTGLTIRHIDDETITLVPLATNAESTTARDASQPKHLHRSTAAAVDETNGLQEILVTAQKRAQTLQSVPVSVTALAIGYLNQAKFDTPSDLATQVPNLQVNGIEGEASPLFSLRGVSMYDYSLNQSSPVASYLDEVYKGNFTLFGVELYDLERIEVLRGPQGTLYGKNTTGGAINYITHPPEFDTRWDLKFGCGNYNRREVEGVFQATVIPERIAARFAFTYAKAEGFIQDVLPDHPNLEGVDQYGLRLSLLFEAWDDLDITLRLSKSMQDPQNYAIIDGRIARPSAGNPGGVGFLGYFRTASGTYTGVPLGNYQVASEFTPRRRQENQAASLIGEWSVTPTNKITSISSWDEGKFYNPEDTDGAPYQIWNVIQVGVTRQYTQDLRLTSTGNSPLQYIAGLYYQHEQIFNSNDDEIFTDRRLSPNCIASSFGAGSGYSIGLNINPGCDYFNSFDEIIDSWSAYTDNSYKVADWMTLRAGLRYNRDNGAQKNALDQLRGSDRVPLANLGFFSVQPDGMYGPAQITAGTSGYGELVGRTRSQFLHNNAVTGRAGIDFNVAADALLYLSYNKGYRSGAFSAQFLFTPSDLTTVEPEYLDSYEAGLKTSWLDHRLEVDGAAFYYQYRNQQIVNLYSSGQQPLINLGRSRIEGGELEVGMRPIRALTLRLGMGFLNSEVKDGELATGSIRGQQLPYAPHFSGTAALDWEMFKVHSAVVDLHLDSNYVSKQYLSLPDQGPLSQAGYSLLNGRLSLKLGGGVWEVGVWGRNITNRYYLTNALDVQGFGYDYRHVGAPRMYGGDMQYHF